MSNTSASIRRGIPCYPVIAASLTLCYNAGVLGNSLTVGQRTLNIAPKLELLSEFLKSRRQGLSPNTLQFYEGYLKHSGRVIGPFIAGQDITSFLNSLRRSNGGKHAYFRALRAFYSWSYSRKSGYNLNPQDNPTLMGDPSKLEKRILPSLTEEQVETLIDYVESVRDKCIISLPADSSMRLSEIASIKQSDIDWNSKTISIIGKGNKERRAPFTDRTAKLLRKLPDQTENLWGINKYGIQQMLERLEKETGIKCNPHAFRRGFACNLHRKGLSTLTIVHLGGREDLSMVQRYIKSITFDDCLAHYREVESG